MRVHHINCGTFCPPARQLVNGSGGYFKAGKLTCHCLVLEGRDGLTLVDTGLGLRELTAPARHIGPTWTRLMRPKLAPEDSARHQLEQLGFYHDDVRHVVLTHLDFDHAGGLVDFPTASVHVFEPEYQAAMQPRGFIERFRYKPEQWAHGPAWERYSLEGERWFGFEGVRALVGSEDEVLLIPLPGHTRGHCGVAVRGQDGWLLHAGDAYFCHHEIEGGDRRCPPMTKLYERVMQVDRARRVANQERLQALAASNAGVRILCSHDPVEFRQFAEAIPATGHVVRPRA